MNEWSNETVMNLSRHSNYSPSSTNIKYEVGNFGDTGYRGIAFSGNRSGGDEWSYNGCIRQWGCRLATARTNTSYSQTASARRGTHCQEIGHLFGLGHSPGDCLGKSYFSQYTYDVQPHSADGVALLRYIEAVYGV
jgi:hypothetical protein